jgi:hypothetical protein
VDSQVIGGRFRADSPSFERSEIGIIGRAPSMSLKSRRWPPTRRITFAPDNPGDGRAVVDLIGQRCCDLALIGSPEALIRPAGRQ